jgi:hypothetical protein
MKKLLVLVCCLLFALPLYAADTAMDSFTDDSASPVGTDYLIGYSGATGYRWTINSITGLVTDISGNAGTATALAADPADCAAGQVATGIAASGALTCTATPSVTTLTGAVSGNASTASALAANGANCDAGSAPRGVDASGAAENCTAYQASNADLTAIAALNCTENQIMKMNGSDAWVCAADSVAAFSVTDITGQTDDTTPAATATIALAQSGSLIESTVQQIVNAGLAAPAAIGSGTPAAGTFTSITTSASADPTITLADSDNAAGTGKIYANSGGGANDVILYIGVEAGGSENVSFIEVDGVSETVDMLKPVVLTSTLAFVEAQGNTTITVGDNAGAVALTLPNATGTIAATGTLTNTKWCSTDGTLINCTEDAPAGSGDITAVGSCASGSCATIGNADTSGGYIDFLEDSDNGTNYVRLKAPDSTADATVTLPSATGTLALNDQTFYIGTTQVAINRGSAALTLAGLTLTTPDIGAATGTSLALGADPAETGVIMLANGAAIGWEDATEATITHVNDTGLKFNLPVILSNDESISNVDDTEITFVGTEAISLDLDTGTANQVQWKNRTTSTTGVTNMDFVALNLSTTGTISGGVLTPVIDDADNFAANFTGANLYGGTFIVNAAGTAALPNPAVGMNFTIVLEGAVATILEPLATGTDDTIVMNGLAAAQGEYITSSTRGAMCVFQYRAADSWMATCNGFAENTPP